MFIGHFGLAMAAKKVAPRPSLGTLVLAAQLVDGVWPVFLLLGWEDDAVLEASPIAELVGGSGDVSLDRAAWGGITASDPFSPLPKEFHGPYLALRFHFYYNPAKGDIQ